MESWYIKVFIFSSRSNKSKKKSFKKNPKKTNKHTYKKKQILMVNHSQCESETATRGKLEVFYLTPFLWQMNLYRWLWVNPYLSVGLIATDQTRSNMGIVALGVLEDTLQIRAVRSLDPLMMSPSLESRQFTSWLWPDNHKEKSLLLLWTRILPSLPPLIRWDTVRTKRQTSPSWPEKISDGLCWSLLEPWWSRYAPIWAAWDKNSKSRSSCNHGNSLIFHLRRTNFLQTPWNQFWAVLTRSFRGIWGYLSVPFQVIPVFKNSLATFLHTASRFMKPFRFLQTRQRRQRDVWSRKDRMW